jgi:hypothetical protein
MGVFDVALAFAVARREATLVPRDRPFRASQRPFLLLLVAIAVVDFFGSGLAMGAFAVDVAFCGSAAILAAPLT